jgi:predicted DNA-binding transcriptional regulator AlpA
MTDARISGQSPQLSAEAAYLSEVQFCARFGIHRRTAQRWRTTGEGPPFIRLGARRVAYRVADAERWADARTYPHRAAEMVTAVECAR